MGLVGKRACSHGPFLVKPVSKSGPAGFPDIHGSCSEAIFRMFRPQLPIGPETARTTSATGPKKSSGRGHSLNGQGAKNSVRVRHFCRRYQVRHKEGRTDPALGGAPTFCPYARNTGGRTSVPGRKFRFPVRCSFPNLCSMFSMFVCPNLLLLSLLIKYLSQ